MKSTKRRNESKDYWVGLDVSKQTFDVALAGPEQRFPSTPVRALRWKAFPRTREGVVAFLAWLDEQVPKRRARVIMEATGKYSLELTTWLLAKRPTLRPAIENPKNTKAFIDSLSQRNRTDGLNARGLAFYGVERRPAPYEPLLKTRQELRELSLRGKTRMCKRGNKRVRRALYLSAMATLNTKKPNSLSVMHYRLCEGGKQGKEALGAVMRKQLTIMRAVLISGKPYDPTYKGRGKLSGQPA